ncbi:MAG: hypothetical protein J0665_20160 [Deltaproteobacteria bacterium]|nr:hypothetical protein [Deltaproteobacteria bacterium]
MVSQCTQQEEVMQEAAIAQYSNGLNEPAYDTTGFIAPLISSHETFTLIEDMAAHLKGLICNEIGLDAAARILSLVDEIKKVASDGKEEISCSGLSW